MQTTAMTDNQQYRDLVEAITTYAIFLVDPLGHVLTWNTGAERITGFASDEVLGAHSSSFQPSEDAARCLEGARAEGVCEQEGWWTRNDGDRFWAEVAVTALR